MQEKIQSFVKKLYLLCALHRRKVYKSLLLLQLMATTPRGEYVTHLSRIRNHLDWYLQQTFTSRTSDQLPIADIRTEVRDSTGVKVREQTILNYNARQFSRYQTAPLEWVGDDNYRMNENYYRLLGEKVFAPKVGRPGRPKKNV